jgi:hypothetical protein
MKEPRRSKFFPFQLLAILFASALLLSCARGQGQTSTIHVTGPRFALDLVPGPAYRHDTRFLFFKIPMYPQVACWIETPDGRFLETVYVTTKSAKKSWFGAPSAGRPEALPVWGHAQQKKNGADAERRISGADAVSAATSAGEVRKESAAATLAPGRYIVKLEVNSSFDYTERFTKATSGVNGQPSLVYSTEITVGSGPSTGTFAVVGTGSGDGSTGDVTPGTDGITTALQILQSARIDYSE